eukprot:scaffold90061_cov66-Phaeocystis_antarctica.AAC.11
MARPAFFFFFLDFFERACPLACSASSSASSSSIAASARAACAACTACMCCRMSSAMAVWPWFSAHCRAVSPSSSISSVLALARSSACTHASSPPAEAIIRAVLSSMFCRSGLAECCSRRSRMEGWP